MSKKPLKIKKPHLLDLEWLEKKIDTLPKEKVTSNIVDVCEKVRVMPANSPYPGRFSYRRTPYMHEIAMELSPQSPTEFVTIQKGAQLGATTGSTEAMLLFKIAQDPGNVLFMVPSGEFLKKMDSTRIMPMIEASGLKDKLKSSYKKNSNHGGRGDAVGRKSFIGGKLDIITFAQLNQLRNQSYSHIAIEDAEELVLTSQKGGGQGDVKKVAIARTTAYAGRRKILDVSTPILAENSHIHSEFLKGDRRRYYIPCPSCGHMQTLEWKNLKYQVDEHNHVIEESVYYECQGEYCDFKIKNEHKSDFLLCEAYGGKAEWRPHNTEKAEPLHRSYQFSTLYSPVGMTTWYDLAVEWVAAQGDAEALQAFVNLRLGEPFSDYSEAPPASSLHILKGSYKRGTLPKPDEGNIIFTMLGCDVQQGNKRNGEWIKGKQARIEASLWAYGLNNREWLIDHYIINGDTSDWRSGAFAKLREMILKQVFPVHPVKIFIDSRYQTDQVKQFCNGGLNIFPIMGEAKIKGADFRKIDLTGFQSGTGGILPLYELKNNNLKRTVYNRLGLRKDELTGKYPPGYMMFPVDLESRYFEQLTAERPVPVLKNGRIHHYEWDSGGRSNETFDCKLYANQARNIYAYETSILAGEETTNESEFWKHAEKNHGYPNPSPAELLKKQKMLHEILYGV